MACDIANQAATTKYQTTLAFLSCTIGFSDHGLSVWSPLVLALWDKLTVPDHELELAVLAAQDNINPTAREYFLAALEACRNRRQEAQHAPPPVSDEPEESGPADPFSDMDRPLPE